ncbi:MAG: KGGVGR-motif variant AAA ATPase [Planctomycetaceae bacterium]
MSTSSTDLDSCRNGRILTFYSYKGGTGRSMSLANVAWILAMNGHRVLMLDWDLEAPGLHRWFGPLLDDPELHESRGLIEFFTDFREGSEIERIRRRKGQTPDEQWFLRYADLAGLAVGVDFQFPDDGCLHLVPAGRQNAEYSLLVQSFDWHAFYEKAGGGVFLEAVKKRLRSEYDFILIDSRTGISDTAGICTVQMPDDLVVCFTMNRQSILGAREICRAADEQRTRPDGSPGLRIWPVPMRVELAEKERLDNARRLVRSEFAGVSWQLNRRQRRTYWQDIEVLYVPYYACEETLATLADTPGLSNTLLHSMERIAGRIAGWCDGGVINRDLWERMPCSYPDDAIRLAALQKYSASAQEAARGQNRAVRNIVIVSSSSDVPTAEIEHAAKVIERRYPQFSVFHDARLEVGERWQEKWEQAIESCDVAIVYSGRSLLNGSWSDDFPVEEFAKRLAASDSVTMIPVAGFGVTLRELPTYLRGFRGISLDSKFADSDRVWRDDGWRGVSGGEFGALLCEILEARVNTSANGEVASSLAAAVVDPEDPNKGRFGGLSRRNGSQLTAEVKELSATWWEVRLTVRTHATSDPGASAVFHLHPTFINPVKKVPLQDGMASHVVHAWGAFTVGVELDGGRQQLELDLAELPDVSQHFRDR